MKKSLVIIGVGKMASLLAPHLASSFNLHYYTPANTSAQVNGKMLSQKLGGQCYLRPEDVPPGDCYLLGVKPQQLAAVLAVWRPLWPSNCQLVSLLAGVSAANLHRLSKVPQIVRLMPNIAVEINAGCTGIFTLDTTAANGVSVARDWDWEQILQNSGRVIRCHSERDLDLLSIAAGSGPAFFLAFVQSQLSFFQQEQMDMAIAQEAVAASMMGAAQLLLAHEQRHISQLITNVTSKGGITAAALECWQRQAMDVITKQGLQAAWARLQQLNYPGDVP